MSKRAPATISIVTTDGQELIVYSKKIEAPAWTDGLAKITTIYGATHEVTMDLTTYNALVADWALSAPGRTRGLQFAIRAHAKAGRLKGDEVWPRNKSPHAYGRPQVGRPAKA